MAEAKVLSGAGLRGQVAGKTALSTVGKEGAGLTYRGYDVRDLAEQCEFEEVAYLIFFGELPTATQLAAYKAKLKKLRGLPQALKTVLENIPKEAHPMDVMRTGASMLGNLETELSFTEQQDAADRLLAAFPSIITYWYRFSHDGVRIETETDDDSIGSHFLHLLNDEKPKALHAQTMNVSLILYAEHEFNASTFTARVCASTLSDMHSCVTAAIGSLRGPLHGGANEQVMHMMIEIGDPAKAEKWMLDALAAKRKVMGFGHRVYRKGDSRVPTMKKYAGVMAQVTGQPKWMQMYETLEKVMVEKKKIYPNLDFPAGPAYYMMGFEIDFFTPIFVMARTTGWSAHIMEQMANNRIIRPLSEYIGAPQRMVKPLGERN